VKRRRKKKKKKRSSIFQRGMDACLKGRNERILKLTYEKNQFSSSLKLNYLGGKADEEICYHIFPSFFFCRADTYYQIDAFSSTLYKYLRIKRLANKKKRNKKTAKAQFAKKLNIYEILFLIFLLTIYYF
jgi:hypothetical protein